jgi:DNA polymerase-1
MSLSHLHSQAMRVLPIFEEMQRNGMPASRSKFQELSDYVDTTTNRLQNQLNSLLGYRLNVNSQPQVADEISRRGIVARKRTKGSNRISVGKKSIEHARHTDPFVGLNFTIKEHLAIKSKYVRFILDLMEDEAARREDASEPESDLFYIHGNIQPVTVVSRRLSISKPPLLQMPTRTEIGNRVRDCYVAPPGQVFASFDFSAQELRVAADFSQDAFLYDIFTTCLHCRERLPWNSKCSKSESGNHEHRDPHAEAAARNYGIRLEDVTRKERNPTKTATFGVLNGLAGTGLQDQFFMYIPVDADGTHPWADVSRCEELCDAIKNQIYPGLGRSSRAVENFVRQTGFIRDYYGRDRRPGMIRYLPSIRSKRRRESAEAARQAFNLVIQGTAQYMAQATMAWLGPRVYTLQPRGKGIDWRLEVHDEYIFTCNEDQETQDELSALVLDGMINHSGVKLRVPISAEGHFAKTWGGLK